MKTPSTSGKAFQRMGDNRIPISIPVQPWFYDHHFGGKVILAGVETMLLLAAKVKETYPEVDIRNFQEVRFSKFLEIPEDVEQISALIECEHSGDGQIRAKLLSRVQFKKMSRIVEHGGMVFGQKISALPFSSTPDTSQLSGQLSEISTVELYRERVPFGPSYQTLQDSLMLGEHSACCKIKAPAFPSTDTAQEILGSPFPLDGAMHAACVLGQTLVDFTPFPVGMEKREVLRPTQPDGHYLTKVNFVSEKENELLFDLVIFDEHGTVYETVSGLAMRDVSKGIK